MADMEDYLERLADVGKANPGHEISELRGLLRAAARDMGDALPSFLSGDDVAATLEGAFHEGDVNGVETLIDAARAHGEESEPDHEAGDLQDFLRSAWRLMDDDARTAFAASEEAQRVMPASPSPRG